MKKLVTLLAAAGMVVAASAPANAVDVKADTSWRLSFKAGETGFKGGNKEQIKQRLRLGLTAVASENLSGYFQFQIGKDDWGTTTNTHGAHAYKAGAGSADATNMTLRQSYIDWTVPGTAAKVRMGRFALGLPADAMGYGNLVFSGDWGNKEGVAVSAPVTDWLGLTAMWTRVGAEGSDTDTGLNDDLFAVVADLKFNGVSGSVYAAYAALDGSEQFGSAFVNADGDWGTSGTNFQVAEGKAYWVGFTSTLSAFDPFTLKLSAAYGAFEADNDFGGMLPETDGWHVQAMASYKLGFGTPFVGAWYMSGADKDGEGYIPSIGGYFTPTRTYHDAAKGLCGSQQFGLPSGNWGVQAGIEGVSFLSGLSHEFKVTYMEGTNEDGAYIANQAKSGWALTEEDSLVEFDLVNTYKIYKNLSAHLELSYIISDFDSDANKALTEDDWRAELTFQYKF